MSHLSKEEFRRRKRDRKRWLTILAPACFGKDDKKFIDCMDKYFKASTPEKRVLPCKLYDKCLDLNILRKDGNGQD